eukprot:TRINITY_DN683_c0_g1_i1.p1 TRINITY_DN683_c0_g1~~TRINITY_DN683_c0_g1_i1.p1  ORF type:complete len:1291 (+),score=192.44 TRINITY_DN683_c0_g1_i1:89-3961(+)
MIRRPPRSTLSSSSAASDVYKRQYQRRVRGLNTSCSMAAAVGASRQPTLLERIHDQLHHSLPRMFTWYTGVLSNRTTSIVSIIVSIIILVVACGGLHDISYETSIDETWIDNDSRIVHERDYQDKYFGGLGNIEFYIASSKSADAPYINTQTHLQAQQRVLSGWYNHAETCAGCGTAGEVTNSRELTYQATTDAGSTTPIHNHDICNQPVLPKSIIPCPTCATSPGDFVANSGQLPMAWGYAALSRCLWANKGNTTTGAIAALGIPSTGYAAMSDWGLPVTWGLDRFPCQTSSVLHMFQEGQDLGYPACLRAIEENRWSNPYVFGTADANYWWGYVSDASGCVGSAGATSPTTGSSVYEQYYASVGGAGNPNAAAIATQWTTVLKSWIRSFYGMGYRHRTSFVSLTTAAIADGATDDGAAIIADFMSTAIQNQQPPAQTTAQCAAAIYTYTSPITGAVLTGGSNPWTFPCLKNGLGLTITESLVLSDSRTGSSPSFTAFESTRHAGTTLPENSLAFKKVMSVKGISTSSGRNDAMDGWESVLYDYLYTFWKPTDSLFSAGGTYANTQIDIFLTKKSITDMLSDTSSFKTSAVFLICGILLLLLFAVLWYMPLCGSQSSMLPLLGVSVCAVVAAITAGYGLMGWLGVKFSVTTPVVSLVALGLGIDDVFVLLNAYKHAVMLKKAHTLRDTLVTAGPSILITTLSNILGFGLGYLMPIPAVQAFCVQMAVTCVFLLIAILCIMLPVVALHSQSVQQSEDDSIAPVVDLSQDLQVVAMPMGFPQAGVPDDKADIDPKHDSGTKVADHTEVNVLTTELGLPITGDDVANNNDQEVQESSTKSGSISMAAGWFFRDVYAPQLQKTPAKCAVLAVSAAIFGLAIWSVVTQMKIGLSLKEVTARGSYQHGFVQQNDLYSAYTASVVTKQTTWDSTIIQQASIDQDTSLSTSEWVSTANPIKDLCWLYESARSIVGTYNAVTASPQPYPNVVTGDNLYTVGASGFSLFTQWAATTGAFYENFVICHTTQTSGVECECTDGTFPDRRIIAANHPFVVVGLHDTRDFVNMIKDTRGLVDPYNVNGNKGFAYGRSYLYWEQYLNIEARLFQLCAYCIAGIVLLNMFMQVSFRAAALTCFLLCVYVIEMAGALALMNIKLNSFSLVNVVVSIGFAVEYIVHFTRSFIISTGTHDERMCKALAEIGPAIFAGAVTAFLAVLPLAFSPHYLFRAYFFQMFAMSAFLGLFNGLCVWPVILSWVGPPEIDILVTGEPNKPIAEMQVKEGQNVLAPHVASRELEPPL